ncbi:MAG: hypothetical protein IPH27_05200 [Actinomycetales bacterium]|nr:hypothetical protein [Candidatus Phosphoribacter baldrii]
MIQPPRTQIATVADYVELRRRASAAAPPDLFDTQPEMSKAVLDPTLVQAREADLVHLVPPASSTRQLQAGVKRARLRVQGLAPR